MKERSPGFLADRYISHQSEQFDYIVELHEYLWRFVRVAIPGAGGSLREYLDDAITKAESEERQTVGPWHERPFKMLPKVATVSGEPPNYLCSGTLLLRRTDGEYFIGWCETHDGKEFFFFSDEIAGVAKDIEAWAQIIGEEAL